MITLWGRNNSTNVKKVRWVLEELDLPYEQILAGLEFGLNHDPEYLVMNPNGLVPLLKDDATGVVLWESNTIIRYLAAQYGVDRLWLAAPAQRAQGEKWMDWSNGTLSPAHRPVLMGLVRTPPEQRDPAAIAAGISACEALFAMLERTGQNAVALWRAVRPWRYCRRPLRLQPVVDPRQLATAAPSAALVSAD